MKCRVVYIMIVFLQCYSHVEAQIELVLPHDLLIFSPDKRFSAKLVTALLPVGDPYAPKQPAECLSIVDGVTKKAEIRELFTPVYSINWTGDSKTIVTVEHLAGGSKSFLLHYDVDRWTRHEVELPDDLESDYTVIEQKVGFDSVIVTYKIRYDPGDGSKRHFYVDKLRVDGALKKPAEILSKSEIDYQTYERLPMLKKRFRSIKAAINL